MKRPVSCKTLIIASLVMMGSQAYAGLPLWTLTPLTATSISVASNETATVSYTVTNQSSKPHTLVMQPIKGVSQVTTIVAGGTCANPFVLAGHASCELNLEIHGNELTGNINGGPIICQQGGEVQCYRPAAANQLNVTFTGAPSNMTTLSSSLANLALQVSGIARTITITNSGSFTAENLSIQMPTWPAGTTANTTCASTLAPSASCTITVTPGATATSNCNAGTGSQPTPGVVTVTADNATTATINVSVLTFGCIYQKGFVFAIDDTTPANTSIGGTTASLTDLSSATWANGSLIITGAQSLTNGAANTATIISAQGAGTYAATVCDAYSIDSAGNSPCASGTCYSGWYLPAVCQMGASGEQANCPGGLANMETNLASLVTGCVGAQCLTSLYWTSTEFTGIPTTFARTQLYNSGAPGTQFNDDKGFSYQVRCARSLT